MSDVEDILLDLIALFAAMIVYPLASWLVTSWISLTARLMLGYTFTLHEKAWIFAIAMLTPFVIPGKDRR